MLTVEQILDLAKSGYGNEGSCFGVSDSSRLRPILHEPIITDDDLSDKEGRSVHIDMEEFMNHLKGK
jgi:hypothetical protein